jgi:hypothetical protein
MSLSPGRWRGAAPFHRAPAADVAGPDLGDIHEHAKDRRRGRRSAIP